MLLKIRFPRILLRCPVRKQEPKFRETVMSLFAGSYTSWRPDICSQRRKYCGRWEYHRLRTQRFSVGLQKFWNLMTRICFKLGTMEYYGLFFSISLSFTYQPSFKNRKEVSFIHAFCYSFIFSFFGDLFLCNCKCLQRQSHILLSLLCRIFLQNFPMQVHG
jgi:hypothetical protein